MKGGGCIMPAFVGGLQVWGAGSMYGAVRVSGSGLLTCVVLNAISRSFLHLSSERSSERPYRSRASTNQGECRSASRVYCCENKMRILDQIGRSRPERRRGAFEIVNYASLPHSKVEDRR